MRRLRFASSPVSLNLSSGTSLPSQIEDLIAGIQAGLSQVITEWNAEVYPVLSGLSQGRDDPRWRLSDNTTCAKIGGLDGRTLLVDNAANAVADGGRFWRADLSRPKTVKESLSAAYVEIQSQIAALRQEFATQVGEGITDAQKARIGMNVFNASLPSAAGSIDAKSTTNQQNITQLALDLYGGTYTLDGDGAANLATSIRDSLNTLLTLHSLPTI